MKNESKFVFRNSNISELGGISVYGHVRNVSTGISTSPMRIFGRYALVYTMDGNGEYSDGNGFHSPVKPGDLIFVFPELPHSYRPLKGGCWSQIYLVFDGPVFRLWEKTGLLNPSNPILHLTPIQYWAKKIEGILGAPRRPGSFTPPLMESCHLQVLLGEILWNSKGKGKHPEDIQWIDRACALLNTDLNREMDFNDLSRQIGLPYHSFRKKFTKLVGIPPARYRTIQLINWACELIRKGNTSNKQIAEQLGFYDEFHFSKCFKRVTGVSPRQFRRQIENLI